MRLSLEHSEDNKPYLMATAYQYQYQVIGCQEGYQITAYLISISYNQLLSLIAQYISVSLPSTPPDLNPQPVQQSTKACSSV
jgi:hypothetical protein